MKQTLLIFHLIFILNAAYSQTTLDSTEQVTKEYTMGEVVITEQLDRNSITADEMRKNDANEVSSALNSMPSVLINKIGSRNESAVFIRGFDIRSIPVFIDGVPVYIPYDGYVDLARFTTYDISRIDVSKGFSSMMYGPNTIGGAINLISDKPEKRLEIDTKFGVRSGKGYDTKVNIGSNLGKFYLQGNFSLTEREHFPLSADFDTTALEQDYKRDNSNHKDIKGSFKLGFSPKAGDEYAINYIYSHGSKGNPVYLGNDDNTPVRYWDWPYWDKQSLYFISKTFVGSKSFIKTRFYYDQFKNRLDSYDDATYSSQTRGYAFTSFYDDYTLGGIVEMQSMLDNKNTLKISVHYKNDNHSEHNKGEPKRHFTDNNFSLNAEHIFQVHTKLKLVPGVAYHLRQSLQADDYNPEDQTISQFPENTNDVLNAQLGSYYRLSDHIKMNFNIAYKTRFATMKDRYSYRTGRSLANPDLQPETALNLEFATSISLGQTLTFKPELYYSRLANTIQMVDNVSGNLSQVQNTGNSQFAGADLKLNYTPLENLKWYATYSYIKQKNLSNPELLFIHVPTHKIFSSLDYQFAEIVNVNLSIEYNSERYSASDGNRISAGYLLANTHLSFNFAKWIETETGINNVFDKNFTIEEGYPEPGRNFYLALRLSF